MSIISRLKNGWNAFKSDGSEMVYSEIGSEYGRRPDRKMLSRGNEKSIVNAIYNRIALDVASIDLRHVKMDENGRYLKDMDSGLNTCLSLEANIDQTSRAFIQDVVMSMFDEGSVAIVPIATDTNPLLTDGYDIYSLRTGKIVGWYPENVRVDIFNERTGRHEEKILPKRICAIVENPFYAVMNSPSSTMQRLIRKLNLLDSIDEQSGSGKLDIIVQLPYTLRTPARRAEAEERRTSIENQLKGSKYGIAYIDGTEHVTQLNRPAENNLMGQIEYLTSMLYSQLGITQTILDETADERTMLNYNNRTIEPIISAIADAMKCKFLSKTARTQMQSIEYFRDPFRLVPINNMADIADKFTRNEIMTSNEMRQVIGMKPADDPSADELRNKNIQQPVDKTKKSEEELPDENFRKEENQNGETR